MDTAISVTMCTFNGAQFVAAQIESILAQTWTNFELVVFDDASTDETPNIVQAYARRDSRIIFRQNPHRLGYNENFTRALGAARGAYIAPADQDDVWLPRKLERLLAELGNSDLVYCDSEYIDSNGISLGKRMSSLRRMYSGKNPLVFVFTNCVSGHSMLVRSDLVRRSLPPPPGMFYDWWLAIRAANGNGVRYLDEPLVRFRRHNTTATSLGGVRQEKKKSQKEYLSERLTILDAIATLDGPHQRAAIKLRVRLEQWLKGRSRAPFLWQCLLRFRSLFYIMSARPWAFLRGSILNSLLTRGKD